MHFIGKIFYIRECLVKHLLGKICYMIECLVKHLLGNINVVYKVLCECLLYRSALSLFRRCHRARLA